VVDGAPALVLASRADAVATYRVHVTAPRGALSGESADLRFVLRAGAAGPALRHDSVFIGPRAAAGGRS